MVALGAIAWVTTPAALRRENDFTWGPMAEVATIFAGIFATMMPALLVRCRAQLWGWVLHDCIVSAMLTFSRQGSAAHPQPPASTSTDLPHFVSIRCS